MKISFVNGARSGEELVLAPAVITVGREPDNLVELAVDGVSRYHGRFRRSAGGWLVEDLGSTNGIKVNELPISGPHELVEGDLVTFGNQTVRLTDLADEAPPVVFTPLGGEPEAARVFDSEPTAELLPPPPPGAAHKVEIPAPPAAPAEPAAAPVAAETPLREILEKGGGLFSGKPKSRGGEAPAAADPRKAFYNRLFYTVAISLALVIVALTFKHFDDRSRALEKRNQAVGAAELDPRKFLLHYEKEIASDDNVFRFALTVENGFARFTIDDLKSERHFATAPKPVGATPLEDLRNVLKTSGFMELAAPPAGRAANNRRQRRLLVAATDGKFNRVEVLDNTPPRAFDDIEFAINNFADGYGLQTIALTPEQLRKQAEDDFQKAEDLFRNQEAELKNLAQAIQRFRVAVEYLEQFSPKPALWSRASERLREAEKLRQQRLDELERRRISCGNMKDFDGMRQVFLQIMELADPDSKEYLAARKRLLRLDQLLNKARGK